LRIASEVIADLRGTEVDDESVPRGARGPVHEYGAFRRARRRLSRPAGSPPLRSRAAAAAPVPRMRATAPREPATRAFAGSYAVLPDTLASS
jgi:hypothetical protein